MYRINAAWQNWPGAPGVTTFFQNPAVAQPNPAAIRTFFAAVQALIPSGLTISVASSGDLIEETTGTLAGTWSATPVPAVVTGTGAGAYAGNAGAVIHWLSSTVVGKRRLRGRSFLVPLISTAYDTAGSLSTATLGVLTPAAQALMDATAGHMVVWHRPRKANPAKVPPVVASVGSMAPVTSIRVPDLAVSLRSRRV
jgi:hypothetical protein